MTSAIRSATAPDTAATADAPAHRATPDERLAAAFGNHIARWARQQGAAATAASLAQRAATLVSEATSNGHSCLSLDELLESLSADCAEHAALLDAAAVRSLLIESKVVGVPAAPASLPLILDDQRLYLHRYFDYECRLAASLGKRRAAIQPRPASNAGSTDEHPLAPPVIALLEQLFAHDAQQAGIPDWQKIAAITALLGRLTIISGGPGTGKTTTVVNLLACLLASMPNCRIALAAPTGKAAARMTEVILQRAGHLPEVLREKLPTAASTIHRLLGSVPGGEFRYHAMNRLPVDVLVVDEASMLDLALAVHLIEAVPDDARIILLGDKDQLAAVESGAVFSELSAQPTFSASRLDMLSRLAGVRVDRPGALQAPLPTKSTKAGKVTRTSQLELPFASEPPAGAAAPANPAFSASANPVATVAPSASSLQAVGLEDCVIWLRRNYRFASGSAIGLLATETNSGNAAQVLKRLQNTTDASLRWINDAGSVPSTQAAQAILEGYAPYVDAIRSHGAGTESITAAFARFRILCAVRNGPWGVNAINQHVSAHFRRTLEHPLDPGIRSEWYPGRPVMVLRNDHVLKLFNGDIGIVLPDVAGTLQVYFPSDAGEFRAIAPVRLPDHETAFAMTVHKSQGSEFDEILLVLPAEKNRILTRELLYTAVTRARSRLSLVANAAIIASTIETATKRVSGLLARLRDHYDVA